MTSEDAPVSPKYHKEFFALSEFTRPLNDSIFALLAQVQGQFVKQRLSDENTLRFQHGEQWTNRANPAAREGAFHAHSAQWETPLDGLINADMTLIPRFIQRVSTELQRQFMEMLYRTLNETCEETGNTVSMKEAGSFPAGFMEMMRKIEFGVDRSGNVSVPEIHVGTDAAALIRQLESQPPEYQQEIERIKAEKSQNALRREQERKQRFKSRAGA